MSAVAAWILSLSLGALPVPQENPLQESVREALTRAGVDVDGVQVRVRGTTIVLSGRVKNAREKLRAIEAAFSVSEVEDVESELEVLGGGTPPVEEEIWLALLHGGLEPGITEVLVREGVALVRGEVPDRETHDRVLAAVRSVPGVSSVHDELTVAASSPRPAVDAATLPAAIVERILTYEGYTVFDHIQFSIEGDIVVLHGAVTELSKKQELEERIRGISGIGRLDSEVRVLPSSKADVQLRETLFRRIYEDPLFAPFADSRNPPVHIIVDSGWVTLTGIVDELMQRISAETLVRNVFGISGVRNQIRVRER